ncbi:MAG: enoyl-CoA hydratase [Burkholderiaceae bacterium]
MSIKIETFDGIARIEIARPEKKNALSMAMYLAMAEAIGAAQEDSAVRAILIHGQPDVFTAGNDIEDFMRNPPTNAEAPVFQFMLALGTCDKPVVAAVNGPAVGIGTTMLYHCDLAYCGAHAMFSMPFVALGLCSEFGSSMLVPINAGYHKAAEKLLLSEPISADEALEMKIVNQVLDDDKVLAHAMAQAQRFVRLPPAAVRETKRLMKAAFRPQLEKLIQEEATSFGRMLKSPEAKEAFTAFLERRKPDWSSFS